MDDVFKLNNLKYFSTNIFLVFIVTLLPRKFYEILTNRATTKHIYLMMCHDNLNSIHVYYSF